MHVRTVVLLPVSICLCEEKEKKKKEFPVGRDDTSTARRRERKGIDLARKKKNTVDVRERERRSRTSPGQPIEFNAYVRKKKRLECVRGRVHVGREGRRAFATRSKNKIELV
jgi:hypothetical protein